MKDSIHFAHGNGFPALCYGQLLNYLNTRYSCCYIDRIGHDKRFPVTENWHCLVDEVVASVKSQCQPPVIGLGHSLGGVLTLLAAIEEPELFKVVIMIDSPLINRFKSTMVRFAKMLGFIDKVTPAGRTRGRKVQWQNREQLWSYLKSRPLFKTFREDCLMDYINFGFQKSDKGYHLRFDPHIEYSIFRTIPHHLHRYEKKLLTPTYLIYGDKSNVVDRFDIKYMRKMYGVKSFRMKGTHMLPMEHPELVADQIFAILDTELDKSSPKASQE